MTGSDGGPGRGRVTLNRELSYLFPVEPHEDLHFVEAWQPFFGGRLPFCETESAGFAVPWNGLIMDEFAIAIPKRGPLCLRCHLIIGKDRAHICDGVLKNGGGCEFVKVIAVERKLKRTENSIGIWCHDTFE